MENDAKIYQIAVATKIEGELVGGKIHRCHANVNDHHFDYLF